MQRQKVELVKNKIRYGLCRNKSTVLLALATTLLTLQCISCSTISQEPHHRHSDVFADEEIKQLFSDDVNGEHLAIFYFAFCTVKFHFYCARPAACVCVCVCVCV